MKIIRNENGDAAANVLRIMVYIFVALCAAGLYYLVVNMKSFVMHNPMKLELYYKQAKRFNPEQKEEFLKTHAGLWVYRYYGVTGDVPLKKIDLLELKDNGIIWEVVEWDVKMPSGKESALYQIRTGYVEPYGIMRNDTLSDAYTIHQSFITSSDTCFGGWNFLDLWVIRKEGASLVVSKRKYEPYQGAITEFFPHGMIDLVGMGGDGSNRFFNKTGSGLFGAQIELKTSVPGVKTIDSDSLRTNAMALPDCLDMNSLIDVLKKELFGEYEGLPVNLFNHDSALSYVGRYYQPLFVYEQFRFFPRPVPAVVNVSFMIKNDGTLEDIRCKSPLNNDKMFYNDIVREVKTWHFPRVASPIPLTYTFTMP
jgi:hypothetical protein